MRILKNQGGFTLIEVIMTAVVLAIGVVAVLTLFDANNNLSRQAKNLQAATKFAQSQLDFYRSVGYLGVSNTNTDVTSSMPTSLGGTARACSNTLARWACVLTIKGLITNVHTDSGWDSAIAIGTDGMPVIAFDSTTAVSVKKCEDPSCVTGGGTTTAVDSSTHAVGSGLSMAIGSDGFPIISHYLSGNQDLAVTHCGNAACTSGNYTNPSVDTAGNAGSFSSIAIGTDGLPVISYSGDSDIRVTKCGNIDCSSGNFTTTLASGAGTHGSIAVPSDNLPVISFVGTGSNLKMTKCSTANCSSNGAATVASGSTFSHTSIKIGSNGYPTISYMDVLSGDLRLIMCGNAACGGRSDVLLDDDVNYDQGTSLDIGTDGLPVVAYRSSTGASDDTMVVKCGSTDCSQGVRRTVIDATAASGTGRFASVSAAAGAPVISYLNRSDSTLRVAKCASADCDPNIASATIVLKYLEGSRSMLIQMSEIIGKGGLGT